MKSANGITQLSLYHYDTCPFCKFTQRAIKAAGVKVDYRNINQSTKFNEELIKFGGKRQVPALKIEYKGKKPVWLYESADIVDFIQKKVK